MFEEEISRLDVMTFHRTRHTAWIASPPRVVLLDRPRRIGLSILAQGLGLALAVAVVGLAGTASGLRADQGRESNPIREADPTPKSGARLAVPTRAEVVAPDPEESSAIGHLFAGEATARNATFTSASSIGPGTVGFSRPTISREWKEEEFGQVAVLDGRTLLAGRLRIRLVGLDLPLPEQVCRTLDGRLEPCATRAATQLELLTRWRRVTCLYRLESPDEAIGRCRLGASDLTERMVMTGYAWRSAAPDPEA